MLWLLACPCLVHFYHLITFDSLLSKTHSYLHHKWKKGNFGGFPTGLWDTICGTEINTCGDQKSVVDSPLGSSSYSSRVLNWVHWSFAVVLLCSLMFELGLPLWSPFLLVVVVWILLLDGMLVIFPPPTDDSSDNSDNNVNKVFVVGLSRTGTTSITEALNQLGLRVHHFLPHLVKNVQTKPTVNQKYSDAFDGHTDIATILVMDELAQLYPNARFIHTLRPKEEWCNAM